jgi:hypothetical protein
MFNLESYGTCTVVSCPSLIGHFQQTWRPDISLLAEHKLRNKREQN